MEFKKGIVLLILQRLQFIISSQKLVIQFFSSRLNTRPYNRLDKKVADFKKPKSRPAVLHTIKCFHHQDGEDAGKNKKCKTYIQHQKWNKHYKTIICLFAYTPHKKKVSNWSKLQLQHTPTLFPNNKNIKA